MSPRGVSFLLLVVMGQKMMFPEKPSHKLSQRRKSYNHSSGFYKILFEKIKYHTQADRRGCAEHPQRGNHSNRYKLDSAI